MRSIVLLAVVAQVATVVHAHGVFSTLFIDGASQGDGKCLRTSLTVDKITSPITDLTSPELACDVAGQTPAQDRCNVKPGARRSFEFRLWASGLPPGTIDGSHLGPMAMYAKQVSDMSEDPAGSGWFKIWEDGYDEAAQKWATEKLIDNNGIVSVQVPESLPTGMYLFRPDITALHNLAAGTAQLYVGCAQISVESKDSKPLHASAQSATIPGYIKADDPSVNFNSHPDAPKQFPYPLAGPKPFKFAGKATNPLDIAFELLIGGDEGDAVTTPTQTSSGSTPSPTSGASAGADDSKGDANLVVSVDATCGDSKFGERCSPKGWCGSSLDYCSTGCQSNFGICRRK